MLDGRSSHLTLWQLNWLSAWGSSNKVEIGVSSHELMHLLGMYWYLFGS